MCSEGVIALELGEGTYNGDRFLEFLTGTLIPEMLQFDGNSPRSVLVMVRWTIALYTTQLLFYSY